jgi:hypothetical protein
MTIDLRTTVWVQNRQQPVYLFRRAHFKFAESPFRCRNAFWLGPTWAPTGLARADWASLRTRRSKINSLLFCDIRYLACMVPDPVMPGRSNLFAGRKLLYVIGLTLQDKAIRLCDWMCCLPSARSKRQTLKLTGSKAIWWARPGRGKTETEKRSRRERGMRWSYPSLPSP